MYHVVMHIFVWIKRKAFKHISILVVVLHEAMSPFSRYSGTCVLWIPWDQPKVSRLSRCPDIPGQFI